MNTRIAASILLTALLCGGIAMGLNWVTDGFQAAGWLLVIAVIVMMGFLWWPRKRSENS